MYKVFYSSPIGLIKITGIESGILGVEFTDTKDQVNMNRVAEDLPEQIEGLPEQVIICREQLDEYFKGKRRNFSLDIVFTKGTDFQKKVWKALLKIPYGKTSSYGEIAKAINNEKAARAVGNANNKNPISIIIPCHRVIGSNGRLVGYGGGLWRKKWLLEHERNNTIQ
ncbi:MAG: methylated-DNA--[protein]-cysteine S-methyltransferase [Clostridiaceae bacterium]|nr:methylated-DNA--[protein]-cysteine S-methyltransferase [Clostridiaceae bacterium]